MNAAELLAELSVRIYQPPLVEQREVPEITDVENPLSVLILIVDFETAVMMHGVNNLIGNSTGRHLSETVAALEKVGCHEEAVLLGRILEVATRGGMTHQAIRDERRSVPSLSVTSFAELHGSKWDKVSKELGALEDQINYERITMRLEDFVGRHQGFFEELLAGQAGV